MGDPTRARAVALATAAGCLLSSTSASALYEEDSGALALGASLRSTSVAVSYYDSDLFGEVGRADVLSQSQLRLTVDGYPRSWFGYELHLAQDLWSATSSLSGGGFAGTGGTRYRYRIGDGAWDWLDEPDARATLTLDRANVRYHFRAFQLSLGRQAISFGKARFWNPLDAFLPFDPRQFDREYKPGIDAVRANVPMGDLSGVELVGVLGRDDGAEAFLRSWRGSALLGRVYTNWHDWDLALQGGKVYGGYHLGAGLSGVVGPLEVRAEGTGFWPLPDDPVRQHFLGVVGVGKYFDSSLNLQLEYLYNGVGDTPNLGAAFALVEAGRALQVSEHVLGGLVAYDLFPLLNGALATVLSASDGSALILPQLEYSVSDESALTLGAMVAVGRRPRAGAGPIPELQSEFGTYPDFYFMQYRVYF